MSTGHTKAYQRQSAGFGQRRAVLTYGAAALAAGADVPAVLPALERVGEGLSCDADAIGSASWEGLRHQGREEALMRCWWDDGSVWLQAKQAGLGKGGRQPLVSTWRRPYMRHVAPAHSGGVLGARPATTHRQLASIGAHACVRASRQSAGWGCGMLRCGSGSAGMKVKAHAVAPGAGTGA